MYAQVTHSTAASPVGLFGDVSQWEPPTTSGQNMCREIEQSPIYGHIAPAAIRSLDVARRDVVEVDHYPPHCSTGGLQLAEECGTQRAQVVQQGHRTNILDLEIVKLRGCSRSSSRSYVGHLPGFDQGPVGRVNFREVRVNLVERSIHDSLVHTALVHTVLFGEGRCFMEVSVRDHLANE